MSIKVQGQVVISNDKKGLFDQVNPGAYTTAERDALSPNVGDIVYNSQDEELQVWNGTDWGSAGSGSGSIGSPVDVLSPVDGAGVSGAVNYTAKTSEVSTEEIQLYSGYISKTELVSPFNGARKFAKNSNGVLIMGSTNYGIRTSLDNGLTWQAPVTPMAYITSVLWTGQKFLATSRDSPYIIHSSDGINWTAATLPGNYDWDFQDLTYSPTLDRVVACNIDNGTFALAYSNDHGVNWSGTNPPSSLNQANRKMKHVRWGNGRFVATNYTNYNSSNYSIYSTDGINWNVGNAPDLIVNSLIFNPDNNTFYGIGRNGSDNQIFSTSDGNIWSSFTYGWGSDYNAESNGNSHFVYDNGVYYIMVQEGNGRLIYSTDLTNWNRMYLSGGYAIRGEAMSMIDGDLHYYSDTSPSAGFGLWRNRRDAGFGTPVNNVGSSKSIRQVLTFQNNNVYNFDTGEIVADADFATAFDRNLRNDRTGQTFSPSEVTDGVIVYLGSTARDIYSSTDDGTGDTIRTTSALTIYGPSPTDLEFTSSNTGTSAFNGTEATLAYRTWTLDTRASDSDPWTNVVITDDYDPVASQDGATPWSGKPTLAADTQYRVKVEYHSANARSVESDYNYFTTGPS